MIRQKWNTGWQLLKPGMSPMMASMMGAAATTPVNLPHDAMVHEKRTPNTKNAHQTGFYPGGIYQYTKTFDAPQEWTDKDVLLEFEGVYQNAMVYVNGDYAGGHPCGYTNFTVSLNDFLIYGASNTVKVVANNSAEENSRWYSGSGIYRPVNLYVGNKTRLAENGVRITTPEVQSDCATVQVELRILCHDLNRRKLMVTTELLDCGSKVVGAEQTPVSVFAGSETVIRQRILVDEPKLWDVENPNLYTCSVTLTDENGVADTALETFGIRTLSMNPKHGFCLNGKTVKLRGACIHHDNGILGAATFERAEERRCEILKNAGFNCIRSSHHPLSRAMLNACDRLGMLVLDELADAWTRTKNNNDYAQNFPYFWAFDVEQMVAKDYNHPSVIMYIAGNEIQEASTAKGAELCRTITNRFHALDDTRYVTVAINGLLACVDHMGEIMCSIMGITMEQMAQMMADQHSAQQEASTGVDQANGATDMMFGPMADAFAANSIVTDLLDEFASVTDLTGYNYLTARHVPEHDRKPNRVILGTETLPQDIVRLWQIVKDNPHVIGDMTWTGWDYLGESGIGVFYYDGRQGFSNNWPTRLAYIGDIDITGYRRPFSYYREIIFGRRTKPYIAVERVDRYGQTPNRTAWMWKDEVASWTWKGFEHQPAVVNVYSSADEVELLLNGTSIGRKPVHAYCVSFETDYQPGTLEAVAYICGQETGRDSLCTAGCATTLCVQPDRTNLHADGEDISFIRVSLTDGNGIVNMQEKKRVSIMVEGNGTLQGFGSADPDALEDYDHDIWETYDGSVLAAVRTGTEAGEIRVTFQAAGCADETVTLTVN